MIASELLKHFHELGKNWIQLSTTRDIIYCHENQKVQNVLVTWVCDDACIDYAIEHHFDTIISHESLYWTKEMQNLSPRQKKHAQEKLEKVKNHHICVIRNHDCWDRLPQLGVNDAFAKQLQLNDAIKYNHNRYISIHQIPKQTVKAFANHMIKTIDANSQNFVEIFGDENQFVETVGIGTGCYCDVCEYMELGAQLLIVSDDGSRYWHDILYAVEQNYPVIRVYHSTSEEQGMKTLTKYLIDTFQLHAQYFVHETHSTIITK